MSRKWFGQKWTAFEQWSWSFFHFLQVYGIIHINIHTYLNGHFMALLRQPQCLSSLAKLETWEFNVSETEPAFTTSLLPLHILWVCVKTCPYKNSSHIFKIILTLIFPLVCQGLAFGLKLFKMLFILLITLEPCTSYLGVLCLKLKYLPLCKDKHPKTRQRTKSRVTWHKTMNYSHCSRAHSYKLIKKCNNLSGHAC